MFSDSFYGFKTFANECFYGDEISKILESIMAIMQTESVFIKIQGGNSQNFLRNFVRFFLTLVLKIFKLQ